jgi:hypothetical protein
MFYTICMATGEIYNVKTNQTFEELCDKIVNSKWLAFCCDDTATNKLLVRTSRISSFVSCNI